MLLPLLTPGKVEDTLIAVPVKPGATKPSPQVEIQKPTIGRPMDSAKVIEANVALLRSLDIAKFPFMEDMSPRRARRHPETLSTLARCTMYTMRKKNLEMEAQAPITHDYTFPTTLDQTSPRRPAKPHRQPERITPPSVIEEEITEPTKHQKVINKVPPITYRNVPTSSPRKPKSPSKPAMNTAIPNKRRLRARKQPKLCCPFTTNPESPRKNSTVHLNGVDCAEPYHSTKLVTKYHGHLTDYNIEELMASTGYSRPELYTLWSRFKALCSLSKSPKGIDQNTFRRGVPLLSIEDALFVDRVFSILDEDESGIIEWPEFIQAMSALEKGDVRHRIRFLFQVYDLNCDGTIGRDELATFFISSLMVNTPNDDLQEVTRQFVEEILYKLHPTGGGVVSTQDVINYIERAPQDDIFTLFGRTMVTERDCHGDSDTSKPNLLDDEESENWAIDAT